MICHWDDHRFDTFQFKVEFIELYPSWQFGLNIKAVAVAAFYDDLFVCWVIYLKARSSSKFYNCSYSVEFTWEILWMQISDVLLLPLYEEHNSVMKKIWRRLFKPVGSQHILFALQSLLLYMWRFYLTFKFVMRIRWGARRRFVSARYYNIWYCYAFGTIQLSLLFQEGSIAEFKLRCIFRSSFIWQLSYRDIVWPCHGFFINHYKSAVFGVRVPYQMLLHEYCLPRFVLTGL
jgi:hypothetical protein